MAKESVKLLEDIENDILPPQLRHDYDIMEGIKRKKKVVNKDYKELIKPKDTGESSRGSMTIQFFDNKTPTFIFEGSIKGTDLGVVGLLPRRYRQWQNSKTKPGFKQEVKEGSTIIKGSLNIEEAK